jgi:hypothetical protein
LALIETIWLKCLNVKKIHKPHKINF